MLREEQIRGHPFGILHVQKSTGRACNAFLSVLDDVAPPAYWEYARAKSWMQRAEDKGHPVFVAHEVDEQAVLR